MTPQLAYTMKGLGALLPQGRPAFRDLWLSLPAGARVGVIGPAGAGKTTLLRIMAGELTDFEGEAGPAAGVTVGYLPPAPCIDDAETVAGAVEAGVAHLRALLKEYDAVMMTLQSGPTDYGPAMEEQGRLQQAIGAAGAWRLDRRIASLTDALRLPPGRAPVGTLSAAGRRRVALCRLLLQAPDLLLLDEPADDLDAEVAAWLDRHLADYPGTVVAATRDRCFLEEVADWILELDGGAAVAWRGGYTSWLEQKQQQLDAAAEPEADRRRAVQREIDWLRMPPRGRPARARAQMQARAGASPGPAVVEAEGIIKGYGERALIGGLSFTLPPGGIAGVLGPGGSGKTTLLKLIAGHEAPDAGAVRRGAQSGRRFWPRPTAGRVRTRRPAWPRCSGRVSTSCSWTSPGAAWMSLRCARWRTRCSRSPAARWWLRATAGSSTASPPTSLPSRATAAWNGSPASIRPMRPIAAAAWGGPPTSRTASGSAG